MKRLLIINNIPTPYRTFMFNKMYEVGKKYDIEVNLAYQATKEPRRNWKPEDFKHLYPYYYSKTRNGKPREFFTYGILNLDIIRDVVSSKFDYVMYAPFMSITGWFCSLLPSKSQKILWSESNLKSAGRMSLVVRMWKRILLSGFKFMACPGINAQKYVYSIKPQMKSCSQIHLPNLIDTSILQSRISELKKERIKLRAELAMPEDVIVILGIGQMKSSKGFHLLIDAAKNIRGNFRIIILGAGPLLDDWRMEAKQLNLTEKVYLPGYRHESEIIKYYTTADWFIHPALSDPSPLVCIESIFAGLPVAISKYTGNAPETVSDGLNGFLFDPLDSENFRETLQRIINTSIKQRERMGQESLKLANKGFDPEKILNIFFQKLAEN